MAASLLLKVSLMGNHSQVTDLACQAGLRAEFHCQVPCSCIMLFAEPKGDRYFVKTHRNHVISVVVLLMALSFNVSARDDRASIEQKLADAYQGKTVMLRGSYCGGLLEFDGAGKVPEDTRTGDWTICRDIQIDDLKLTESHLQIRGRRILSYFDTKEKRFRDAPELWSEALKKKEKTTYAEQLRSLNVTLRFEVPPGTDQARIESLLNSVFWPTDTAPTETASSLWRCYFTPESKDCQVWKVLDSAPEGPVTVFRVGGDVEGPKIISAPDPNYSESARCWKLHGMNTFNIVVDEQGRVRQVAVVRPLGLSLDASAAAQFVNWKFKPATRAGTPVSVAMRVEVNFNLY